MKINLVPDAIPFHYSPGYVCEGLVFPFLVAKLSEK